MCGLVGLVAAHGAPPPDPAKLRLAALALRRRGPDGSDVLIRGCAGFAHTRLSIIDLDGGAQPMANEDGTVWTVYNGEIWNFEPLRRELVEAGHRFATRCDTEVLVHGYEEWGDGMVARLDGMFAFALWDERRERLLLARDRIGKKPLYVSRSSDGLAFGSDARSIHLATGRAPRLNEEHLAEFLFQRYVGAPRTLFCGIERLPPAHLLTFDRERVSVRRYWALPTDSGEERIDSLELRALLREAVRKRLMSDVPLGVLLSGGVDSAAVLGLMKEAGAGRVETFTIGFDDPIFDERPLARITAEHFGSNHHEVVVGPDDFIDALPRLAWLRDEPIAEPAEIPMLLLAEFAAQSVKVVLSGEGGDELFGGYPKYRAELVLSLPTGLPAVLARGLAAIAARRPSHRQLTRAIGTMSIHDQLLRWASWFRSFSVEELSAILAPRLADQAAPDRLTAPLGSLLAPYANIDAPRRMLLGDLQTYLPDNMLLRGDHVLMGASLEGRMPLLDREIVEQVVRAPASQRVGLRTSKKVLREALHDLIPVKILDGPKRGFPVPVARFLLEGRGRVVKEITLSERALDRGLFDAQALRQLVETAGTRATDSQLQLFTLASLELWLRTNVDELRSDPPLSLQELAEPNELASSSLARASANASTR